MKKFLLTLLLCLTLGVASAWAEEKVAFELKFLGNDYTTKGASGYKNPWTHTYNNKTWKLDRFNNNWNNTSGWKYVKAIEKKANISGLQTATIATQTKADEAISSISINITRNAQATFNSLSLEIADNADFTNATTIEQTVPTAWTGSSTTFDHSLTIPEPKEGMFYKIIFCLTNTTSTNGALQVNSIQYLYDDTPAGPVEPGDVLVNGAAAPEEIEVAQGETITFTSDKAAKLKFESDELGIIDEIEGSTYTHTADFTNAADGYFLTVTPCDNEGTAYEAHAATVMITRKAAPLCGEITFTPADGAVYAGNAVTIACENATEIKYTIDGGEELTYDAATGIEITAACTIVAWGLNGDGVEGDKATLNVTIKEADKYVLINRVSDIKPGAKYVLFGKVATATIGRLMGSFNSPYCAATSADVEFTPIITIQEGEHTTLNAFTLEEVSGNAGKYSIQLSDGKYLGTDNTKSSGGADFYTNNSINGDGYNWTISFDGQEVIIKSGYQTIYFNNNANPKRFKTYSSAQSPVYLYRLIDDEYYTDEAPAELHIHGSHYAGSWAESSKFDQTAAGVFTFYGFLAYEEGEATPALVFSTTAKKKADDPNTEVTGIRPRKAAPAADYWNDIDGDVFMPETDGAAIGTHKLVRVSTADLAAGKASLNTFAAEHNKSYDLTVDFNGYSPVATVAEHDENNVPTGVENIDAAETAEVEYFNLSGLRVANPENGIFIRRQGNKVTKVLVK